MKVGLNPSVANARDPVRASDVERRRHESPLGLVIHDLRCMIADVADASSFLMVVTDADGIILWREGSATVRNRADRLGFSEGAEWTEERVGTNAIGTALAEKAPIQLFSAEHFEQGQHPWYCTAYPIHDPRNGELLGIVDVSGPALTLHPAIGALVGTAVKLAESQLWRHHQKRLERIRKAGEHMLAAVTGPALVVDDHGWVVDHCGVATRDRIDAPRADIAIAVPGMGLCVPERLRDGWLIRPAEGGERAVVAVLDVRAKAVLEVRSDNEPWRIALSKRHAKILELLCAAGPVGLTVGQLSSALYGDEEHAVSVRAEISRLRRLVGALVATQPYRVAYGVSLTVVRPN